MISPIWVRPANAFLAYLKPTEKPIKSSIFRKDHSIDRLGGMATGQSLPEQGALGFSGGGTAPLAPTGYGPAYDILALELQTIPSMGMVTVTRRLLILRNK